MHYIFNKADGHKEISIKDIVTFDQMPKNKTKKLDH